MMATEISSGWREQIAQHAYQAAEELDAILFARSLEDAICEFIALAATAHDAATALAAARRTEVA